MDPIINLRLARKQAKRRQAESDAAQNRLVHGRSKAEKALARARNDKLNADLEQRRIERKEER